MAWRRGTSADPPCFFSPWGLSSPPDLHWWPGFVTRSPQSEQGGSPASTHELRIWPSPAKSTAWVWCPFLTGGEEGTGQRGWRAGPAVGGWWLLQQAVLQPSPAHQVMSNGANINVSVLLSVVKSVFVVLQFIFSLPALWMLSADMSGWYPLPKIHTLSTFLRSWVFSPSLWHADVKFLPGSVIHKTVHT